MRWAEHGEYMARREMHTGFWRGNVTERGHLADLGLGGRIILKLILARRDEKNVIQDMDTWQAFVDIEMELRIP
jgi:hypothetical protein